MDDSPAVDAPCPWWRTLLLWSGVGVALRLALFLLAGEPELHKDEASYVYLALGWSRFGVLGDAERYLWPPLWPWTLRQALELFGRDGLVAAKLLLVFGSASVGISVMGIARRISGPRSASLAGAIWALYLPLAAYTHLLWAEPLFLIFFAPALWALVAAEDHPGPSGDKLLLTSGLCLGSALLVKEAALFLVPLLALGLLLSRTRPTWRERGRRASLLLLAVAAVLAPWTARNQEVYGHLAPSGLSLGANAFNGLNAHAMNFDVLPLTRRPGQPPTLVGVSRAAFLAQDPGGAWPTAAEQPNTAKRSREELRRGLAWVRGHPADFLRTRVKKLADFVLPTSYYVRHQALRRYPGPLGSTPLRRTSVVLAMLSVVSLLALALPGARRAWSRRSPGTWVLLLTSGYFLLTSALVSSSRFRVPLLPVLFVFAAIALGVPRGERAGTPASRWLVGSGWAVLAFLWWVDLPELNLTLEKAW